MSEVGVWPVAVAVGDWRLVATTGRPTLLDDYRTRAELTEHFTVRDFVYPAGFFFIAVDRETSDWPSLVVTQEYAPTWGFGPGALLIPEACRLFVGAGDRLLSYECRSGPWSRSWIDEAEVGFWAWQQHDDVVLMSAELELAAWSTDGEKLWTTFVEPPWSYVVEEQRVRLDVMGELRVFSLSDGP
jgi:hypothetical protein